MKQENVIQAKSEDFALRICKLNNYLVQDKKEKVISKQILRSGTSIGANIAEGLFAESTDDFIHKLKISRKEASETKYWLKLLFRSGLISENQFQSINKDCEELLRILSKIILSTEASK